VKTWVMMRATAKQTRLVVTAGEKVVLRASLPPLAKVAHERAAKVLLEALSLWLDEKLCVALCAGDEVNCFRFDLTDELGVGAQGIYYAIEVVAREPGRGRTDHEIVAGQRALVPVPPSAR
jgi:hypothetical protein